MPIEVVAVVDVRINDKSLLWADPEPKVIEERLDVTTRFERDPDWTLLDAAGHLHAYTADGALPTLKTERVHEDCTDPEHPACDGYTRTVYRCWICDEVVEPASRKTEGRRYAPGRKLWEWNFRASARDSWRFGRNGQVSIWSVREGKVVHFGIGDMVVNSMDSNGFIEGTVCGVGELGQR